MFVILICIIMENNTENTSVSRDVNLAHVPLHFTELNPHNWMRLLMI
jgi:hypothetical protein